MKLVVRRAVAMKQPDQRRSDEDETRSIERLQLDTTYNPVHRVSYVVNVRVLNSVLTSTNWYWIWKPTVLWILTKRFAALLLFCSSSWLSSLTWKVMLSLNQNRRKMRLIRFSCVRLMIWS